MNTSHQASLRYKRILPIFTFATLIGLASLISSCGRATTMDSVHTMQRFPADRAALAAQMEDESGEHIHMPPIPLNWDASRYINTLPDSLRESLKGKVVLIDIWDYTCVNCIRTLPYITQWNEKYKNKGLVILGVHAPEFEFEKDPKNLDSAVKQFGLTYPIIADNEYKIWQSLANQYWPAKYLFDQKGILRTRHFGEGQYQEFEAFLQKILLERDSTIELPALVEPVRETDKPGAVCYRPTPETYVGFSRSHIGNSEAESPNEIHAFKAPASLSKDLLYFDGKWEQKKEYARPAGGAPSSLLMDYQAKEVNLVIHPLAEKGFKVWVEQNGAPLPKEDRGTDIHEEAGRTYLFVENPRMYNIVNNSGFRRNTLRLTSDSPSFGAYAFTFTTACQTP